MPARYTSIHMLHTKTNTQYINTHIQTHKHTDTQTYTQTHTRNHIHAYTHEIIYIAMLDKIKAVDKKRFCLRAAALANLRGKISLCPIVSRVEKDARLITKTNTRHLQFP